MMRFFIIILCGAFFWGASAASADEPLQRLICDPPPIKTGWDDVLEGVKTRQDWQEKRKVLRKRFLELIGDDAKPAKRPPLDIKVRKTVDVDGAYTRMLISYNVEADQRATAYLTIPLGMKKGERKAAVVVLHGTAVEGKDVVAGFMPRPVHKGQGHMDELARRGYVVIAPDHFNMGERLPAAGTYNTDDLYLRHPGWSALGKIAYDASIAVDVLETLDYVDAKRIGAMGHSLGGQAAIYLAAYDGRIAAAACNDGSHTFRFNTSVESFVRPSSEFAYFPNLRPLILAGKLPPIDVHEIIALIAPRPFLDCVSVNDIYSGSEASHRQRVLMDLRLMDIWAIEGAAANFAFYVRAQGHSCQHDNNELMFAWLDKHLCPGPAKLDNRHGCSCPATFGGSSVWAPHPVSRG